MLAQCPTANTNKNGPHSAEVRALKKRDSEKRPMAAKWEAIKQERGLNKMADGGIGALAKMLEESAELFESKEDNQPEVVMKRVIGDLLGPLKMDELDPQVECGTPLAGKVPSPEICSDADGVLKEQTSTTRKVGRAPERVQLEYEVEDGALTRETQEAEYEVDGVLKEQTSTTRKAVLSVDSDDDVEVVTAPPHPPLLTKKRTGPDGENPRPMKRVKKEN